MEKPNKDQDIVDEAATKYTGGNFMNYDHLIAIVKAYQQRQKLCEDVDELEKQGGKIKKLTVLGPNTLFDKLGTSLEKGIPSSSISERRAAFGSNEPPIKPIKSCMTLFFEALNDLTLIILMIAAAVSIVINMITEEEHRNIGIFLTDFFL